MTILEECPSEKLPTYPSPKPTICPKWEASLNVSLVEGYEGSFPETWIDPFVLRPVYMEVVYLR